VDQAATKAKTAALALSAFRNKQGVIDPERQAAAQLQQVAKIQDELLATTTQLAQITALTPRSPQIPVLENRAKTLRAEMAKETAKVTGDQKSLSGKAADYQRLALDADFANKQLCVKHVSSGIGWLGYITKEVGYSNWDALDVVSSCIPTYIQQRICT
jgi:capsular polysaccharide transport system permease protein